MGGEVFAQGGPLCAVELFGVGQSFLGEAEVPDVAARLGREVAEEGDGGFDVGVEGEGVC